MHTANFELLGAVSSVRPDEPVDDQVDAYAEALLTILGALPATEASLISAMNAARLGNKSFMQFASFRFPQKTVALQEYLRKRRLRSMN